MPRSDSEQLDFYLQWREDLEDLRDLSQSGANHIITPESSSDLREADTNRRFAWFDESVFRRVIPGANFGISASDS